MTQDADKNLGTLSLVRGGLYAKGPTLAAQRCKERVRMQVYRLRAQQKEQGRFIARGVDSVAEGCTNPAQEPVKLIYRLKQAGCSLPDVYRAVIMPQTRELYEAYNQPLDMPDAA